MVLLNGRQKSGFKIDFLLYENVIIFNLFDVCVIYIYINFKLKTYKVLAIYIYIYFCNK